MTESGPRESHPVVARVAPTPVPEWSAGIAPDWGPSLAAVADPLREVHARVAAERAAGARVLPADAEVLAALRHPLADVRVLIVGQDPYPTPGHPLGLAFATSATVRPLPRSLGNIYRELHDDLGIPPAAHGDLSAWSAQGVLLLNRALTVRAGEAGSHRGIGWDTITRHLIHEVCGRGTPLAVILWGNDARSLAPELRDLPFVACIESAHPSPLSASRGFFGSRPFSRANAHLMDHGASPVDWRLPDLSETPELLGFSDLAQ